MRIKILMSVDERQGGVSTYVRALEEFLPREGVEIVSGENADVLLHVGPHHYKGLPGVGKKSVMVVHDLIPEVVWGDEGVRAERKRALAAVDAVIAVSGTTKNDLVREYGVDPEKIRVVYHGCPRYDREMCERPMSVRGPYLLYVGKRNEYKRFRWFLRAVAPLMWRYPRLRIQCTGDSFCRREWAWIIVLGLLGRVTVRRFADEEMPSVYAHAEALVYPSVYEGFGLPVLEAMAAGCPVVISRSSCLPEVAGDSAAYFEADSANSLHRAVSALIRHDEESERLRTELISRGRERAKRFSWESCARETASVLRSVIG